MKVFYLGVQSINRSFVNSYAQFVSIATDKNDKAGGKLFQRKCGSLVSVNTTGCNRKVLDVRVSQRKCSDNTGRWRREGTKNKSRRRSVSETCGEELFCAAFRWK